MPVACAAYAVYLVHAIADWDWELAGVTLAALFCGMACLLAAREEREPRGALDARARRRSAWPSPRSEPSRCSG